MCVCVSVEREPSRVSLRRSSEVKAHLSGFGSTMMKQESTDLNSAQLNRGETHTHTHGCACHSIMKQQIYVVFREKCLRSVRTKDPKRPGRGGLEDPRGFLMKVQEIDNES